MALPLNPDRPGVIIKEKKRIAAAAITGCLSCLIVCGHIFSGCATTMVDKPLPAAPYPAMPADLIAEEIANTEAGLTQLSNGPSDQDKKADLLLRLAMLYVHPDKPDPDYQRAFDYLKQYTELEKTVHAEYALVLLTRLSDCVSARKTACTELLNQKQKLEKQCRDLSQENLQHKQIIEKLKTLDVRLEKKRKSLD